MTDKLKQRINACSFKHLEKYLGLRPGAVATRSARGRIPNRHKRRIVEYFEMLHDDNMAFCDELLKKVK